MKLLTSTTKYLIISTILISCNGGIKNETELSQTDLKYLEKIGLKSEDEKIILFDSQLDNQTSGNLITDKRLATYWIDKDRNINKVNFAYYNEIDTLLAEVLSKSLTYASYIKVVKNDKSEFRVHVDDNEKNTTDFFKKAISEWKKWKK